MKQLVQHLDSGALELVETPCPQVAPGHLLLQTRASVISAGTERMLVEFARGSLLSKARRQPQRVRQAIDKMKTDGIWSTVEAIRSRLDQPLPLGYSSAGEVIAVGEGVDGFRIGDRVASNGPHAEVVHVPKHLCAKLPASLDDERGAFAVLGAIPLQGMRLLKPELGEVIAVYGLGLLGMLAVQLLTSAGAKVIGIDIDEARLERGDSLGAIPVDARDEAMIAGTCRAHTAGIGVDGVLVTASACDDNVLRHAAAMCRKRGRIVLVGAVDMELDRSDFYEKELSFQVSCSYGPGRYDAGYEQAGIDYPLPYVRWTEQRNIAAVVDLIASGKVDPTRLTTCRLPHQDARRAYDLLSRDRSHVAIVLEYPKERAVRDLRIVNVSQPESSAVGRPVVGVIGAGQFAKRTLVPALQATGARLKSIASAAGLNAATLAKKFSCESATSDHGTILADDEINTVVIATPHHLHAPLAAAALDAGKHVFVEKPLAIDREGLVSVRRAYEAAGDLQLLVGFNRRFSSLAGQAKKLLAARSRPATAIVTVNAGQLPSEHWLHDPRIGGGRVVGEACHWIDLLCHLLDGKVVCVHAAAARESPPCNQAILTLTFDDGSLATLNYLSGGHRSYSKERIEVFTQGRVLVLDNFRRLTGYGWPSFRRRRLLWQDKGHREELRQFIDRIAQGGPPLIPPAQLWNVADATLAAAEALRSNAGSTIPVAVD